MTGVTPSGPGSRASHEAASASSPEASIPNAAWLAGELTVQTEAGQISLPAWLRGSFALDFRVWDLNHSLAYEAEYARGWQLTHVPTGLKVCGFLLPINEAKDAVEELEALTDWSFSDPAAAKGKGKLLSPLRQKLDEKMLFKASAFSPLPISIPAIAMEARRAETVKLGSVADDSAAIAQPHPKGQTRSNKSRPVT